jgi:hypothetical protein
MNQRKIRKTARQQGKTVAERRSPTYAALVPINGVLTRMTNNKYNPYLIDRERKIEKSLIDAGFGVDNSSEDIEPL